MPDTTIGTLPTVRSVFNRSTGKLERQAKAKLFIRGPIPYDWMQSANKLSGKAGAVALALWFLRGLKNATTFAVTAEAERMAACSRQAFARGLKALEDVDLIKVSRAMGRRPIITLLQISERTDLFKVEEEVRFTSHPE